MRTQAIKATRKELAYLSHWRSKGFMIGVNDPIPMNTVTPPSFATRRPVLDAVIGGLIIIAVVCGLGYWIATAAKLI